MPAWTLVTGGAKNLGAEMCRTLARNGHSIVCHYNTSRNEAEKVADQCRSFGVEANIIQGDFATQMGVLDFLERYKAQFSTTKVVVNNVGNYLLKSAVMTTPEEATELFQTNVETPLLLIRGLVETLQAVITIGTCGLHSNRADLSSPLYKATKVALWSLTKSLAKELAPQGIRVNMVSPGYLDYSVDLPKDLSVLPMKRAATSPEVARVVVFLLEDESRYITGQNIEVAGGVGL